MMPDGSLSYMTAPIYRVSFVKRTRTSVRSDTGSPSFGCSCVKPVIGVAAAHAASPSTSPSSVGASAARDAVATFAAAAEEFELAGCATAAAATMTEKMEQAARRNVYIWIQLA